MSPVVTLSLANHFESPYPNLSLQGWHSAIVPGSAVIFGGRIYADICHPVQREADFISCQPNQTRILLDFAAMSQYEN